MKIRQLFEDYKIPFQDKGKNVGRGWIELHCPFCDDPSTHLGFNEEKEYFHCWRCGFHRNDDTIAKLLHISKRQARTILKQYKGKDIRINTDSLIKIEKKSFKFPSNCTALNSTHRKYLERRGFDPDKLIKEWGLLGAGPISMLDKKDYRYRIIIPIMWNNQIVSFQGRDITGKAKVRYKACPKDREIIHHQDILYGDQQQWTDTGICVEGVTDVWRFGSRSFAVFGISYTAMQVRNIAKHFKKVIIVFDNEVVAQQQADKLMAELRFRGIKVRKEIIGKEGMDPAGMKQEDADYFVKQIL